MGKRVFTWLLVLIMLMTALPWKVGAQTQPTLYWGVSGPSVRLAQRRLKAWGYYTGAIDGIYGARMYRAVTYFQRRNGLSPDGLVGPATWAALGESGAAPGGGGGSSASRSDDQYLLARVISAEAKGEPYEGQVAVGAVILNRVRDSRFPHTLAGVVYEPDAFESVSNGAIYQNPTSSSLRAAGDALNGWDPSGGAVFFWNPAKPVSRWIWSRPIITQIGNHVFAR
jgi:N-acetylmuramoyl-L-alanine amidase